MTAIIFPGQGSQYLNMSMDFNENFDVARKVFQEIENEILKGVDYVVTLEREKTAAKPSSIIKLSTNGEVKIIR